MSRLTDEQLEQIYDAVYENPDWDCGRHESALRAVAEAAVAAERAGQEPVAYDTGDELWWARSPEMNDWIRKNGSPLYAFPPAAPVPEAIEPKDAPEMIPDGEDDMRNAYADGWNACRDAMLAAAQEPKP